MPKLSTHCSSCAEVTEHNSVEPGTATRTAGPPPYEWVCSVCGTKNDADQG